MPKNTEEQFAAAVRLAVDLVCVSLPHFSGLARAVRIVADDRVRTAGVFASGRLVVNTEWFLEFNSVEQAFVVAHELLHLALHTHERAVDCNPEVFNIAHDLIINDILETELGIDTPGGGVRHPGARHMSAEALILDGSVTPPRQTDTTLGAALIAAAGRAGSDLPLERIPEDVLDEALERQWFPKESHSARNVAVIAIRQETRRALSLQQIQARARESASIAANRHRIGDWSSGSVEAYVDALDVTYRPPWQLALHRWLDAVTTPRRTYARASRRGADRTDVALPGHSRDTQVISIVLDTSGSMTFAIAHALGSIAAFARGTDIEAVRIVQCDNAVTSDDVVAIDDLTGFRVTGFGGSDMSPAIHHLAADPETTAAVVITDGVIGYPAGPLAFDVLWVVYGDDVFDPGYGQVIRTGMPAS
jgi:predicted metal-dependent peptidase